jgi:hypothetical protein
MSEVFSPQVGCFSSRSTSEGGARARSRNSHEAASQARGPQSGIIGLLHQSRDSVSRSRQTLFSSFSTLTTIYMTAAIYIFCTRGSPCLSIQLDFNTQSLRQPLSSHSTRASCISQRYRTPASPFLSSTRNHTLHLPFEGSPKLQHRPSASACPGAYAYYQPRISAWINGPKQELAGRTESMVG